MSSATRSGDLYEAPPIPLQGRCAAGPVLPALHDHVAVLRIQLHQTRLAPGASVGRSPCALRSAAAGPAQPSPPPRCAPLPGGARAAWSARPAPQSKSPPRPCRAGCRDTLFELRGKLHVVAKSVNRQRDVGLELNEAVRQLVTIAPAVAVTMQSDEPGALARQWQVGGRSDNLGVPTRNVGKGD